MIIVASIIACFAFLCIGPSDILMFPDTLLVMIFGQAIYGIAYAMIMVSNLTEMIAGGLEKFPRSERGVNSMCPGIFSSCLGLGQVVSPLFGSSLDTIVGFQNTTDIVAALNLAFAIAYFACAEGCTAFSTTYGNFKKIEEEQKEVTIVVSEQELE